MHFRRNAREDPEINLIPFIDVLLVVLIFLMLSTTYSRYSELQIHLPTADAGRLNERPSEILVSVTAEGQYLVNRKPLDSRSVEQLAAEMSAAATAGEASVVIVSADALATHQSVITVMEAARRVGLAHITFATQSSGQAAAR